MISTCAPTASNCALISSAFSLSILRGSRTTVVRFLFSRMHEEGNIAMIFIHKQAQKQQRSLTVSDPWRKPLEPLRPILWPPLDPILQSHGFPWWPWFSPWHRNLCMYECNEEGGRRKEREIEMHDRRKREPAYIWGNIMEWRIKSRAKGWVLDKWDTTRTRLYMTMSSIRFHQTKVCVWTFEELKKRTYRSIWHQRWPLPVEDLQPHCSPLHQLTPWVPLRSCN